jgi:arsenate reductase
MTCSVADKSCPVVEGASSRYAIHYSDPRLCDDTPTETAAYDERCREIAREMFYIMSEVCRQQETLKVGVLTGVRSMSEAYALDRVAEACD